MKNRSTMPHNSFNELVACLIIIPLSMAIVMSCGSENEDIESKTCVANVLDQKYVCDCEGKPFMGRMQCNADGTGYSGCFCGCTSMDEPVCSNDTGHLYSQDTCGNISDVPQETCWCGCNQDNRTCNTAEAPFVNMNLAETCNDMSHCITQQEVRCELTTDVDDTVYESGVRYKNTCDESLRCHYICNWRQSTPEKDEFGEPVYFEQGSICGGFVHARDDLLKQRRIMHFTSESICRETQSWNWGYELCAWVCVKMTDDETQCLTLPAGGCSSDPTYQPQCNL